MSTRNPEQNRTPHGRQPGDGSVHIPLRGGVTNQPQGLTRSDPVGGGRDMPGPPSSGFDQNAGSAGGGVTNQVGATRGSGNRLVGSEAFPKGRVPKGYAGPKADLPKANRAPDWTPGAKSKNVPAPQARRRG